MRVSALYLSAAALLGPLAVSASQLPRATVSNNGTIIVMSLSLIFEEMETQFYQDGLRKFTKADFSRAGFKGDAFSAIETIGSDESTYVSVIQETLNAFGGTPHNCTFNTSTLLIDVETMVRSARVIEVAAVGAYLGSVGIIDDPGVLTLVVSIVNVKSQNEAVLNILGGGVPNPQPFGIPLTIDEAATIFHPFISCPGLGLHLHNGLEVTNPGVIEVGTSLEFTSPAFNSTTQSGFFCQLLTGNSKDATALPINQCVVPPGTDGPVVAFITATAQPLSGNVVDRQNQTILAGPVIIFVDKDT